MSKQLYLRTLTPVHIGSGENMEPYEYWHDLQNHILYRLDDSSIFKEIQIPDAAEKLVHWIDRITNEINRSNRDNQKQSKLISQFTILDFVKSELKDSKLADGLQTRIRNGSLILYSIPCNKLTGVERKSKKQSSTNRRKRQISLAIKTASNEMYIPGSSLKGAIRTALLYRCVKKADDKTVESISEILKRLQGQLKSERADVNRLKKQCDDKIEQHFLYCGYEEGGKTKYDDEKYDLLKILKVSDSNSLPPDKCGRVVNVDLYLKGGDIQSQTPAVEAIAENQVLNATISIDMEFLLTAKRLLDANDVVFGRKVWINFKDKFEYLFQMSLSGLSYDNSEDFEAEMINKIIEACREHGASVLEREKSVKAENGRNGVASLYQNFNGSTPIKIGYASGFPSTTVFLALIQHDKLKPVLQNLLPALSIGVARKRKGSNKPAIDLDSFPTSRRYETGDKDQPNPLGWVSLDTELQVSHNVDASVKKSVNTQPRNAVKAKIVDDQSKPPKVEIIEGNYSGQETILPGVQLKNLNLGKGSIVYVDVLVRKGKIEKAEYKGKM